VTLGIRAKLLGGFFVVALFTAALSVYDVFTMERLNNNQRTMYVDVFGGTYLLAAYVDLFSGERSAVLQYLVAEDPAVTSRLRDDLATMDAQMRDLTRQMDEADTDRQDMETLANIDADWRAYTTWRDAAFRVADSGDRAAAIASYESNGGPLERAVDNRIDLFRERKREVAERMSNGAEATYASTRPIAIFLSTIAVGSGLVLGLLLARSIAGAAHQVARAARGLAGGDLNQRIDVASRDELGEMAAAFRDMIGYQQDMARVANAIANRDLTQEVRPKSQSDVLGTAFRRMSNTLRDLVGKLEAREARVQAVLDSVADGIITVDERGMVVSLNPAGARIFGYAAADIIGQPLSRLFVEGSGYGESDDVRGLRSDGQPFPLDVAESRLEVNSQILTILTVGDATERKAAQERAQQLARSDKLRALGEMASGIAHDLNQSLALVAGYGEMAHQSLDGDGGRQTAEEYLRMIIQAALDGGKTVKRLLTFTHQRGEGPRERVDLGQLLPDIVQLTAPQWRDAAQAEGRQIELRVDLSGVTVVEGWPHALREALTNLLFNAFDAMPQGGVVRLSARAAGEHVIVEVSDSGVGMAPEVQSRIFEPFFTTKGERGTGLGLAQVYGIVQQHNGEISVESVPGRGTTFRLAFAAAGPAAPSKETVDVTPEPAGATLRILAIDDEPALARMVGLILSKQGHQVEIATSGEAGLVRLGEQAFDVVITDLGLGSGLNGWQVAEQVRQRWPQVRVVLATGWGAALDPAESQARGVEAVIAKPYSAEHMRGLVARIAQDIAASDVARQ
jgi:signal transduction histidine kinase/CheY-like chemotaxis protein/HAMP domain-containing protein